MMRTRLAAAFAAALALAPAHARAQLYGAVAKPAPSLAGMITRQFVDDGRTAWRSTDPRPLRTAIWYPIDEAPQQETIFGGAAEGRIFVPFEVAPGAPISSRAEKYPLVILSHGTGGSAVMLMWLGSHLAANGYIAAAVNHHGNTAAEKEMAPQGFLLYWERARDLSVVVDRMLADPLFGNRIDRGRIGAAGFSLGGYTVIAAAGGRFNQRAFDAFCRSPQRDFTCEPQPELPEAPVRFEALKKTDPVVRESLRRSGDSHRDPRIRAVFAIAPALGGGFTKKELRDVRVPVAIVVGAADAITPSATNAARYAKLIRGAKLTILLGNVGHYAFLHRCTPRGKEVDPICRDGQGVDRTAVQFTVSDMALRFFDEMLAAGPR